MDSNYFTSKRRGGGFIKGKLRSLYIASASNKVKPTRSRNPSPPATDHGGYMTATMMNQQKSNINTIVAATHFYNNNNNTSSNGTLIVNNQDRHHPKHITTGTTAGGVDSYKAADGGLQVDDESVDLKAANYISTVLERFRLEHLNS